MSKFLVTLILITLLSPTGALAQESPCPRNQPVIVYHQKLQSFLLFGGYCSEKKTRLNDLWSYSKGSWTEIKSSNTPSARSGHAMVYDSKKEIVILFGGKNSDGSLLNDTWSWNGAEWQLLSDTGPEARQSHRLVSSNQGILLFGGSTNEKSLSDTWLFNGNRWKKIRTAEQPPTRRQHTLSYDAGRKRVVLFGGFDRREGEKIIYGDTWEFDGKTWTKTADNPELARDHHSMEYDPATASTYLFGGYNTTYLGDTWSWDGKKWKLLNDDGPARAGKPGMIYNGDTMVLFGGGNSESMQLMDFWMFDAESKSWKQE